MSTSKDYVPVADIALLEFAKTILGYGSLNCGRWFAPNPESTVSDLLGDYETKLAKASAPNAGIVDKKAKNVAKAKLVKALRNYIQGFVARNINVTEEDKTAMRLPIYDREPTIVGDPTGMAEANITFPGRSRLMIQINPIDAEMHDARANYGCRIYYGVYAQGETPPVSGMDLRESLFTRKKKELFTFLPTESGKTAYFSIRYENSKGKAGPWGPMESAVIP